MLNNYKRIAHPDVAVITILNGVVLPVMPQITVAFALSACAHADLRYDGIFKDLLEFGFRESGLSCESKMRLFNDRAPKGASIQNIPQAVAAYDRIRGELLGKVKLTHAMRRLLTALSGQTHLFTSSVIPQADLDRFMLGSVAGRRVAPYLTEALGADGEKTKFAGHVKYIVKTCRVNRLIFLVDAPNEVKLAKALENDLPQRVSSRIIGVAVPTTRASMRKAIVEGICLPSRLQFPHALDYWQFKLAHPDTLTLPTITQLHLELRQAGADRVIDYAPDRMLSEIIAELSQWWA